MLHANHLLLYMWYTFSIQYVCCLRTEFDIVLVYLALHVKTIIFRVSDENQMEQKISVFSAVGIPNPEILL